MSDIAVAISRLLVTAYLFAGKAGMFFCSSINILLFSVLSLQPMGYMEAWNGYIN